MVISMKMIRSEYAGRWLVLAIMLLSMSNIYAQEATTEPFNTINRAKKGYDVRLEHARSHWMKAIPNLYLLQYAGNIGFLSGGIGWDYGKREQWETHMLIGYLPEMVMDQWMVTMTIRESFVPWEVRCNNFITWNPTLFNLSINTVFNSEFWITEKEKYPGDYYRFSSKIRAQIGLGGRVNLHFTNYNRRLTDRISFYYELSTYDLALISYIPNKAIKLSDILALGFGVQYKFF